MTGYFNCTEAAKLYGVDSMTFTRWLDQRYLKWYRCAGERRIPKMELLRFMLQHGRIDDNTASMILEFTK